MDVMLCWPFGSSLLAQRSSSVAAGTIGSLKTLNWSLWRTQLLFSHYYLVSSLFATSWAVAHEACLSMGFPRQEYRSGLPFPFPGDLPDPGIEHASPALADGVFTSQQGNPLEELYYHPAI